MAETPHDPHEGISHRVGLHRPGLHVDEPRVRHHDTHPMEGVHQFPSEVAADRNRLERFEREAQVVAALNHPNIVTVFAIERDEGALFMAMEYLDGKTLAEVIPRGGLPLTRLLTLATQIVHALSRRTAAASFIAI